MDVMLVRQPSRRALPGHGHGRGYGHGPYSGPPRLTPPGSDNGSEESDVSADLEGLRRALFKAVPGAGGGGFGRWACGLWACRGMHGMQSLHRWGQDAKVQRFYAGLVGLWACLLWACFLWAVPGVPRCSVALEESTCSMLFTASYSKGNCLDHNPQIPAHNRQPPPLPWCRLSCRLPPCLSPRLPAPVRRPWRPCRRRRTEPARVRPLCTARQRRRSERRPSLNTAPSAAKAGRCCQRR